MNKALLVIFIGALILRFSLIFVAFHGDLNNNISWGTIAAEKGLKNFYELKNFPYSAPNQPPLTILMFTGLRVIWQSVENLSWWLNRQFKQFPSQFIWFWEQKGMVLLVKLPGVLADLGIGFIIYKYLSGKKKILRLRPELITSIWLFNPVTWYNSAVWGQTDSIVNLLGLISIVYLLKKKLRISLVFLTLSLLFKGSLAIFVPIFIFVALLQKYSINNWLKAIAYSLLIGALISICFHPYLDLPIWLINLYRTRILSGEIGSLTANAFNIWWLVDPGKTLDSTIYLGLPARIWGYLIAFGGSVYIIKWISRKFSELAFLISLSLVSLISFLFMTRIHERYLFPFFPYATILVGLIPGFIIPYLILSITHLFNLYHLFYAPSLPWLEKLYLNPGFPNLLSLVNLIVFLWIVITFLRHSKLKQL